MSTRRRTLLMALLLLAWFGFAAVVSNEYGWRLLLNAVIPMAGGILWVTVFALAAWGAGRVAAGWFFESDRQPLEDVYLQLLAGTAMLIVTTGLLAVLGLLRPAPVMVCFVLWAGFGGLSLSRRPPVVSLECRGELVPWCVAIVVAGGVSLAAATTFAPFYDQWHYHLGFPYHWLREGTVVTFPRQAYSFFPGNMGLLYAYALSGPGGWGAQVVHWWMGALSAAGSALIARRLGVEIGGQLLAAAIFAASPAIVLMGALAGSDLGVAAFSTGCMLLLLRMIQAPSRMVALAAGAGVAAGLSAGCKYSALATVVLPMGVVAIAAAARVGDTVGRARRLVTVGLVFCLGAGIALAPWLVRNAVAAGNPVHPYLESVFAATQETAPGEGADISSGIGTFDLDSGKIVTALTLGTFSKRGRAGDLGLIPLALSPLVFWWAWRSRRMTETWAVVGYVILAVPAWAAGPPLGRYLFPVLAVIAALIGASWSQATARWAPPVRWIVTIPLFVILVANCNPARDHNLFNQIRCFLGAGDAEEYLLASCTQLEPFRVANAVLPPQAKVLLVGEPRPLELDRDVVVEDPFQTPLLVELAEESSAAREMAQRLKDMGVTHLVWNFAEAARIAETAKRQSFLVCADDSAQVRLERFLSEMTYPIERGEWWQILELSQ